MTGLRIKLIHPCSGARMMHPPTDDVIIRSRGDRIAETKITFSNVRAAASNLRGMGPKERDGVVDFVVPDIQGKHCDLSGDRRLKLRPPRGLMQLRAIKCEN